MPMKLFSLYLKQRWRGIAVAILFCFIFAATFALYHLPIEAVFYPASICGVLGLMLLPEANENIYLSARNLQKARVMAAANLHTYGVLNANVIVVAESALAQIDNVLAK